MIKQQLVIGAALVAGVAIGYFAAPAGTGTSVETQDETYVAKGAIADKGDAAALAALRARIKELEAKLAGDEEADLELISSAVTRVNEGRRPRERQQNPVQMLEEFRKNDPERYAQMTNRIAQRRSDRLNRQQSKLDFLAAVDVSGMSPQARETHEKLQDLIVKREEIEDEMYAADLSWDDRREIFERMREVDGQINQLNRAERQNLLNETAKALGLKEEDAMALGATVQEIYDVTGNQGFGGRGGPGGAGGARGGRGGPRGR